MIEYTLNASLMFDEHLIVEDFKYEFDYNKGNIKKFEDNYGFKFDEKAKEKYESFFNISPIQKYKDMLEYISFEFKFGEFCNYYKITLENYYELKKIGKNLYPFPLKGTFTVDDGKEKINCAFSSRYLDGDMIILMFHKNDKYFLLYTDQNYCEFKLIKELNKSDKDWYDEYMLNYDNERYIFRYNGIY